MNHLKCSLIFLYPNRGPSTMILCGSNWFDLYLFRSRTLERNDASFNILLYQSLTFDLNIRMQNLIFVLDKVSRSTLTEILPCSERLDVSRVGVFGHPWRCPAAQAMFVNEQFAGVMNLHGMMFESVVNRGLHKPLVLWSYTGHSALPGWTLI